MKIHIMVFDGIFLDFTVDNEDTNKIKKRNIIKRERYTKYLKI